MNQNRWLVPIGILICILLISIPGKGWTQERSRGSLKGKIYDIKTGDPLPGANIILRGTTMGTISASDGTFRLDRIPPGNYTVIISMMGYQSGVFPNTAIIAGVTTELDVPLKPTAILAPEIIVTANKSVQRIQDSPISIAVLSDIDIRKKNSITVQDALRFTPGVYMTDDQVNIRGSTGYNKGAGSRILVLVDGVPTIAGDTGGINWDALPPTEIARIEVVKGAGSALYGSNALGGVINLITREPTTEPVTRSRLSWGFYDQPTYEEWQFTDRLLQFNSIDLTHSRRFGRHGMLLAFGRKTSTGYRQNGHYKIWNGLAKFQLRISPQTQLLLLFNYTFNNHGNILTWKGPATNDPLRIPPESIGDKIHSGKLIGHATLKTMLRRNLALINKSSIYRNSWQDYFHDNNDFAKTVKLQQEWQLEYQPTTRHQLTAGIEGTYHRTRSSLFSNPYTYDFAVYLQDEWQPLPPIRLTAGVRYDFHQVKTLFHEQQVSPKLGIVWQPQPATALRFSAGKGFRAASIAEIFTSTIVSGFQVIPNLDLRAESAWSYELGLHQILNTHVLLDVSIFQNNFKNLIEPKLATLIPPAFQLDNLSKARIRGLDLSLQAHFWQRRVTLTANYTYLDPRKLGANEPIFTLDNFFYQPSTFLPYRPKHLVQLSTGFHWNRFTLGIESRYVDRFQETLVYTKDARVPQRVTDLYFEARITPRVSALIRANNLLNYHYTEVERNLAPIRHFIFTLNVTTATPQPD